MTFKDLYDEFYEYKSDKVKATTMRTYIVNSRPLEIFWNLKIRYFTVQHYIKWRQDLVKQNLSLITENGYYKFFIELPNSGTKWYDFKFTSI